MNLTCSTFPLVLTLRCLASRSISSVSRDSSSPIRIPVPSRISIITRSLSPGNPARLFTSFSRTFFSAVVRKTGGFCDSLFIRTDRAGFSEVSPASVVHAKNDRTAAFNRWTDAGDLEPESVVKSSGEDRTRSSRPGVTSWQQSPGWKDSATRATSRKSRRYAVKCPLRFVFSRHVGTESLYGRFQSFTAVRHR